MQIPSFASVILANIKTKFLSICKREIDGGISTNLDDQKRKIENNEILEKDGSKLNNVTQVQKLEMQIENMQLALDRLTMSIK